jgi:hypothetical protein
MIASIDVLATRLDLNTCASALRATVYGVWKVAHLTGGGNCATIPASAVAD